MNNAALTPTAPDANNTYYGLLARKRRQEALDKFETALEVGRNIAYAIRDSAPFAHPSSHDEVLAHSMRVYMCNERSNAYIADNAGERDLVDKYTVRGQLWRCHSKFCPTCTAFHARRNRTRLRKAMVEQKPQSGEHYHFITFTIPNPGLSLLATRAIVNEAWRLFMRRPMCRSLIRGGVKSEEFTLTRNGFHYHLHCLTLSKFLKFQALRIEWTHCIEVAFSNAGIPLEIRTSDGYAMVNVKRVTNTEDSIQEVCKYITKADSWQHLKPHDIAELALCERFPRMFDLFGSFRAFEQSQTLKEGTAADETHILDTKSVNAPNSELSGLTWRQFIRQRSLDDYKTHLSLQIDLVKEHRRRQLAEIWPDAVISDLPDD